jgi:RNA polymerase sigma-70 factor (ECF subfamily)
MGRTFRLASAILASEADAHDVVQDSVVAAWRHLPSLRDDAKFDAWLTRVVVNRCRDVLRRRRRSREVELTDASSQTTPDLATNVADAQAVNGAFERLTADQRALLVMHHLNRASVADIARQLGTPVGTAKWRLHAARAALGKALEGER